MALLSLGRGSMYATSLSANSSRSDLGRDSLYLQLYGGINKSANENLPFSEFSSYPWAGGVFLGIGKECSPLWGWRTVLRYNYNKSRNVPECESSDTWGWHSLELFADATYDISDALTSHEHRGKKFNVKAFAGVGLSYAFAYPKDQALSYTAPYNTDNRIVPAVRAGLHASYSISDHWRLGMELSHTLFTDKFNGVKTGAPMDMRSNLKVGATLLLGRKKEVTGPVTPIVYDTRLKEIPWLPYMLPQAEDIKVRRITGRAFLDFPVNETTIYPEYRRNPEELERMKTTIDNALFDKSFKVQSISLHGYASPESPYSNNTRLARGRTQALKNYLCSQFDIPGTLFKTTFTPEDWDNLRNFIDTRGDSRRTKGDIWYELESVRETPAVPAYVLDKREELLRVIDSPLAPDEKEARLKQVGNGQPYRWLLQHVYPGLRHTDYIIEYVVRRYPVKEARRLIYTHPEALSVEEMYKVALSYGEGSDGWLDALMIAATEYPDNPSANLNAASACIRMQRLTDAKRMLGRCLPSREKQYLSDVIRAMEGSVKWKMENGKVTISDN